MWTIEETSPTVHKMRVEYNSNADWRFRILCTSDEHIDHIDSNHYIIKKYMNQAKENNWPNFKMGDLFCAMQGKNDPRRSRIALRNELNDKEEYFDSLVDYAYDFLKPYKETYAFQALGNHETTILKHNETHLLRRLQKRLKKENSPLQIGGFSGWVKVLFMTKNKNRRQSINIRYTHGGGGNSPVTKGVIKTNRRGISFPDADIILSGHTHEAFVVPITREKISDCGKVYLSEQLHVQIPSCKDEVTGKTHGYAVEREFPLKPLGAYWLEFWYDHKEQRIKYDARRVK